MNPKFPQIGDIMNIHSYPSWVQDMVHACEPARTRVIRHELYRQIKDNQASPQSLREFLIGVWPVIWQFPQYMGMSLGRIDEGLPGSEEARSYLIQNIRVEDIHAKLWADWAEAHGISIEELRGADRCAAAEALSHWCWRTCAREPLAVAMAATNYAIEGATGEWTCYIVSSNAYEEGFPPESRKRAMRWLKAHAEYDDKHPWQALAIISTILGPSPASRDVLAVERAIRKSYEYMCLTQDACLQDTERNLIQLDRAA